MPKLKLFDFRPQWNGNTLHTQDSLGQESPALQRSGRRQAGCERSGRVVKTKGVGALRGLLSQGHSSKAQSGISHQLRLGLGTLAASRGGRAKVGQWTMVSQHQPFRHRRRTSH